MKENKKMLNKLFSTILLLINTIVFVYSICIGLMQGYSMAELKGANPALAGFMLVFIIIACAVIIAKMILVTIPTLKNNSNKHLARTALAMDIWAIQGVILLAVAFVLVNVLPDSADPVKVLALLLFGAPLLLVGEISAYKLVKAAI